MAPLTLDRFVQELEKLKQEKDADFDAGAAPPREAEAKAPPKTNA